MAGQTINDRLLAARHSLAGQGLAKSVCKATTEEMIGPKKKHLDYLVQCTNEPNVSIPQLANLLVERSQNANWIVVYKALITVHHMMCYGNERFTQYLASSNSTFQLSNFLDKSGLQGIAGARTGYDMSPFIRRYARYLNEKALSYRTVAFDFCKVKRGKEDGTLRTMNAEKLLKTLPTLQNQLDALLEFDCTANNLTNGVINMCFMLLFRDLIRLFACYNDGVINLLEKYFDMNKKQCREALDLYKKFLIRMDRVAEFLKVAENVGIDKGDIPDLTKAPSSLLDALEQHLASIEGKKSTTTTPTQSASNQKNLKSAVTALSSTSSAFGTAATNGRLENTNGIDESLKQQILAEEEAAMNQYKSKVQSPNSATNPFLSSPVANAPAPTMDLFAMPINKQEPTPTKASDDLLQLNNPFADVFAQPTVPAVVPTAVPSNIWLTNGNGFAPQPAAPPPTTSFVSESSFSSVFGVAETTAATDTAVSGSPALSNPFLTDITSDAPPLLLDTVSEPAPTNTSIIDFFASDISDTPNLGTVLPPTQSPILPKSTPDPQPTPDLQPDFTKPDLNPMNTTDFFDMSTDPPILTSPPAQPAMQPVLPSTENEVEPPRKSVPPPRPPPPVVKPPTTPPVVAKSALDDLNQSIMMSLGSPVKVHSPPINSSLIEEEQANVIMEPVLQTQSQSCLPGKQDTSMPFAGFDGLGGVLQPATTQGGVAISNNTKSTTQSQGSALLTGDLESSLASLAENLSINSRPAAVKGVQWNSPKNGAKPSSGWTPQPMAATTGAGYRPMGQGMNTMTAQPMFPPMQPMGIRPMTAGAGLMTPMTAMTAAPPATANPPMAQQQSLLFH